MDEIAGMGGMVAAAKAGWLRRLMDERQWALQQSIESGERPIVGVNCHRIPPEQDTLLSLRGEHPKPCAEQVELVRAFRRRRDAASVRSALNALKSRTESTSENLIRPIKGAVEAGATMGEVLGTIRQAYGLPYDPVGAIAAGSTI
jgi:methylmalonyl-CoA mutase N-terminal domain/subunit